MKRIHQKLKDKKCPQCSKAFFNTKGMKIHIKAMHSSSNEYPQEKDDLKLASNKL